jgi:DNA polymerase-3 subunit epsilon
VTGWHLGPLTAFDTESTGINVRAARIVTGYVATILGRTDGRRSIVGANVLIDPLIEIPEGATDVHGITTEYAKEHGCDPADGVNSIAEALAQSLKARIPVVGFNLAYDFGLLYHECLRWDLPTVGERLGLSKASMVGPVIDAHVLDKHVDPWRKGSRKLDNSKGPGVAAYYGVPLDDAHTADADAVASVRVAVVIAEKYPEIGRMSLVDLHRAQKGWRAEQMASLQHYFRTKKDQADAWCDPCFPFCVEPTHPSG